MLMKKTPHRDKEYIPNNLLLKVYIWKVCIPLLLLLGAYLIYSFVLKGDQPFLSIFSQGELLILSALILIEAALELREIESPYDKLLMACALLLLILFAAIKYTIHSYQLSLPTVQGISYIPP